MTDKETTQNIKFTINGKFEINAEYDRPINPEQTGIDESQFGLGNQELWLKRNFPKMVKMTISGLKRWNLAKNWWTSGA
ncbi:hypothetical protein Peur_025128 [Populus x canadensis]